MTAQAGTTARDRVDTDKAYYFAYGTLLDQDVMRKVAPSACSCGVFRLDGYRLDFATCSDPAHAGCTLQPLAGARTYGLVYELSREDMAALDRAAGVERALWSHLPVRVTSEAGAAMAAVTYVIPHARGRWAPTDAYVSPILSGLKSLEAPAAYVSEVKSIISSAMAASH